MKDVPFGEKSLLRPMEAAQYFDLSWRKFYRWIKKPQSFIAMYKTRKLVIREELERYFKNHPEEREAMKSARKQA